MLIDKNVQSRLSKLTFSVLIFFQNFVVGLWRLKKKPNLPRNDEFDCYFLFNSTCPRFASGVGLGNNEFWMVIYEFPGGDFALKFRWRKQ